jgi:replicative DNA helicase
MLRRQRQLREIRERALHIAESAQPHADPQKLADEALQRFRDLPSSQERASLAGLHSIREIMEMEQMVGPSARVSTGLPSVDQHARIHGGTLTFIGARPGCGKSALMLDWSIAAATRCGFQVLFFSLEMSLKDLNARLWTMFPAGADDVADVPVWIQEPFQPRPPIGHLVAMSAEFCRTLRDRPTLVVVDYLQIISPNRYWQTRREAVGEVVRELKAMSMSLDVPVIAGAQLSRAFEQRGPRAKPQLSDLKESGEAEEAGDLVLLLHRPPKATDAPEIRVAKNRHGPGGYTVSLTFDPRTARFHEAAREDPW